MLKILWKIIAAWMEAMDERKMKSTFRATLKGVHEHIYKD